MGSGWLARVTLLAILAPVAQSPADLHAVTWVQPDYPARAVAARLAGFVSIRVVVRSDGTIADAQIAKSCLGYARPGQPNGDFPCSVPANPRITSRRAADTSDMTLGLDQAALDAAKQWRFAPARASTAPERSAVIEIEFSVPWQPGRSK